MSSEFLRMQMLAGIITEWQYQEKTANPEEFIIGTAQLSQLRGKRLEDNKGIVYYVNNYFGSDKDQAIYKAIVDPANKNTPEQKIQLYLSHSEVLALLRGGKAHDGLRIV